MVIAISIGLSVAAVLLLANNPIHGLSDYDKQCAGYEMPCDPDYPQPCCYYNTTCLPKAPRGYFICSPEEMRRCDTPNCIANNLEFGRTILKYMDPNVDPCDNFYQFACGNYNNSPATSGRVKFSSNFQKLKNERSNQLDETITQLLSSNTQFKPYKIIRTLYNSCQDFKTNNQQDNGQDSLDTLEKIVEALGDWPVLIRNWNSDFNWMEFISKAQNQGFFKLTFLFADVQQNNVDGSLQIQLSPPDLEYSKDLLKSTNRYSELLEAYSTFMSKVAQELGAEETKSRELLESSIFELRLGEGVIEESSTNMTISQLTTRWPGIQWMDLFHRIIPDFIIDLDTPVNVVNPQYMTIFEELIVKTPKRVQANYAVWKVIQESIPYLKSYSLNRLRRSYWHSVHPNYALPPIDCVEVVKHFLPFSIYGAFVRDHGDIYAKSEATDFVGKITDKFTEVIKGVDWFDQDTKRQAADKIIFMSKVIGFVSLLGDDALKEFYKDLEISEDYLNNYQNLNKFIFKKRVRIVKKPFYTQDLIDVFTYYRIPLLTPYLARYLPNKNIMDLSPEILQGFFFNIDRPSYINYGRAGTIIGHEIGHAFDTTNRYLDKNGFNNNWWTIGTNIIYMEKTRCFADQHNYLMKELGAKVRNTNKSVNENLAVNIGVRVSYLAYQDYLKDNGADPVLPELALYSNNQLFWLSYASQWCSSRLSSVMDNRRVLGTVVNIQEFSKDFKCPVGSNMNPVNKCNLF